MSAPAGFGHVNPDAAAVTAANATTRTAAIPSRTFAQFEYPRSRSRSSGRVSGLAARGRPGKGDGRRRRSVALWVQGRDGKHSRASSGAMKAKHLGRYTEIGRLLLKHAHVSVVGQEALGGEVASTDV